MDQDEIENTGFIESERALLEKICGKPLTDQEAFEAKQDLLGAFGWFLDMDKKYHPERYKDIR